MTSQNNAAKFAFFYLLSLVALIVMAISVGAIIFQIINKEVMDIINEFSGYFSHEALKGAISSLIISAPIYFIATGQIQKNLYSGDLEKESGVRKWLTYFILLITCIIMLGYLIAILNQFLDGELTLKFSLKALTAIVISGSIFSFYLYDVKRQEIKGRKDKFIKWSFVAALTFVVVSLIAGFFYVESPIETRNRKVDEKIISHLYGIDNAITMYYQEHKSLPESLDEINNSAYYLKADQFKNPKTGLPYEYKKIDSMVYEICTEFLTSNKDNPEPMHMYEYTDTRKMHDAGYQCIKSRIKIIDDRNEYPLVVPE